VNAKNKSIQKAVVSAVCVIAVVWLCCCVELYHVMEQPPEQFAHLMARIPGPVAFLVLPFETLWLSARAGSLRVGDRAPDFTLTKLDKSEQIHLSSLTAQGRPVVLVFGSYT
jgi:hypothetical protein